MKSRVRPRLLPPVRTSAVLRPLERLLARVGRRQLLHAQTSPTTKIALRSLFLDFGASVRRGEELPPIWDVGFRVFSEHDEDGIVLFLLAVLGIESRSFVDIGAGTGVFASNCANLAFNLGFDGLFVESNERYVAYGRQLYARHADTKSRPPAFRQIVAEPDNVDRVLEDAGLSGSIDLLSIDIDGNDAWIWQAITAVRPRIVVIEAHPRLGRGEVLAPYVPTGASASGGPIGASPAAMTAVGERLGYRFVGSNYHGYNLFYLRADLGQGLVPTLPLDELWARVEIAYGPHP